MRYIDDEVAQRADQPPRMITWKIFVYNANGVYEGSSLKEGRYDRSLCLSGKLLL